MRLLSRLAPILLSVVAAVPGAAQDLPALYDVVGVAADDVLNLREAPSAGAAILGHLAPDARGIEVMAIEGDWAQVNLDEGRAHAALRYLQAQDGPGWAALQLPLRCFGTEPFWSISVEPALDVAALSRPDTTTRMLELGPRWPWGDLGAAPSAGLAMRDGFLMLRGESCSDGMSDREYGIAADLFLAGATAERLRGCCSLQP